ncbi:MAG: hypothetical protein R2826_02000 [Thermoleophilia bacterium]
MRKRYQHAALRLARAQHHLRPQTPSHEATGMRDALLECEMAFCDLRRHGLTPEGPALTQAARLVRFLDRSTTKDPTGRGVYLVKAEQLTSAQTREVRQAVDAVARWADENYRGEQS